MKKASKTQFEMISDQLFTLLSDKSRFLSEKKTYSNSFFFFDSFFFLAKGGKRFGQGLSIHPGDRLILKNKLLIFLHMQICICRKKKRIRIRFFFRYVFFFVKNCILKNIGFETVSGLVRPKNTSFVHKNSKITNLTKYFDHFQPQIF